MKKKALALLLAACIAIGMANTVLAVEYFGEIRASNYFDRFNTSVAASGGGKVSYNIIVRATGTMTSVGVDNIVIEEQNPSTGSWSEYGYRSGGSSLNSTIYTTANSFLGLSGRNYRITVRATIKNSSGSETRTQTSNIVRCS